MVLNRHRYLNLKCKSCKQAFGSFPYIPNRMCILELTKKHFRGLFNRENGEILIFALPNSWATWYMLNFNKIKLIHIAGLLAA